MTDLADRVLDAAAEGAERWLFDSAFPLWSENGLDRERGGCHERLHLDGVPADLPRRAFVQARQAYCFCEAGRLGWAGAWDDAARHAIRFLLDRYQRQDGAFLHAVAPDGSVADAGVDLYDQAFALFGLAHVYAGCGRERPIREAAERALAHLRRDRAHPELGFREDRSGDRPLRQNPHMHLLEAALAWWDATGDARWAELAEELVRLATTRLLDPDTGCILELFDRDWAPLGGPEAAIIEPGHQHEWAWLLMQWDDRSGTSHDDAGRRMVAFAERHGRDPEQGLLVHDLDATGRVTGAHARIWAQAERLRASLARLDRSPAPARPPLVGAAVEAAAALERFLTVPRLGLWRDKLAADGTFVAEAAPASSFYHLVTAYRELIGRRNRNAAEPSGPPARDPGPGRHEAAALGRPAA